MDMIINDMWTLEELNGKKDHITDRKHSDHRFTVGFVE